MSYNSGDIINGKYRIIKVLGGGAMGMVYHAQHETMSMPVALKVLHGDYADSEEFRRRFVREARAAAMLKHSNICTVSDFDTTEDGNASYLVMELLEGETLKSRLARVGQFPVETAIFIIRQLLSALHCAHQSKIVHRDVKPDNVFLIDRDGTQDFVKLIDFGIAHLEKTEGDLKTLTQVGQIYGTPQYLSPEQALGDGIDFRADLYACGVIFYEMLVGQPPFDGKNYIELLHKQISEPPPHLPDDIPLSKKLDPIIQRLLQKNPGNRFESALEVIELLDRVQENSGVDGILVHGLKEILHQDKPQLSKIAIIVGCILVGIIILSFIFSHDTKEKAPEVSHAVMLESVVASPFAYEVDKFEIDFDPILSQNAGVAEAVSLYREGKYSQAFARLNSERTKYWGHPNFLLLYMQANMALDDISKRSSGLDACILLLALTKDAARNVIVRDFFYQNDQSLLNHPDFLSLPSGHKALTLVTLIMHLPYDREHERIQRLFAVYRAIETKEGLDPWLVDAVELWGYEKTKCYDRQAHFDKLLTTYASHESQIYASVVVPFDRWREKHCKGMIDYESQDCNHCMRKQLDTLVTKYEGKGEALVPGPEESPEAKASKTAKKTSKSKGSKKSKR